jgi:hypothetical protein
MSFAFSERAMPSTTITRDATLDRTGLRLPIDVWTGAALIGLAVCCAMLSLLCWSLDKGFNPMLEGFYVLSCQNPQIYPTFSSFHFFLGKVPAFIANDIVRLRVIELACRMSGAMLLSFSFCRWCNESIQLTLPKRVFVAAMSCIGALYALSVLTRTMSYNGLSVFFVLVSAAFMFLGLAPVAAATTENQPRFLSKLAAPMFFLASGFFAGLDVFNKFTSAACMLAAVAVFLITQRRARALLFVALGAVAAAGAYFGVCQNSSEWWRTFSEAVKLEGESSHGLSMMRFEVLELVKAYGLQSGALILAVLAFIQLFRKFPSERHVFRLLVGSTCLILGIVAAQAAYMTYHTGGIVLVLIALFAALLCPISSDLSVGRRAPQDLAAPSLIGKRTLSGMLFLLLLPCIVSAGTNCDPILHAGCTLAPWFMLVAIGCLYCEKKYSAPYAASLLACSLLLFVSIHFVHQGVFDRQDCGDLTKCTSAVNGVPALAGIKLNNADAESYKNALQILKANGFVHGDPIVCLYDQPGFVYAMGGTSPGQAWYVYGKGRDDLNAHYMRQAHLAEAKRVFLLATYQRCCFGHKLLAALRQERVPLKSFVPIGKVQNPLLAGYPMLLLKHRTKTETRAADIDTSGSGLNCCATFAKSSYGCMDCDSVCHGDH